MASERIHYKRSRFSTRLPKEPLYTAGHYWLQREDDGIWRVGLTQFATRMLGEAVELDFETASGTEVETGQVVGWLEGFKAVTDLFAPMSGTFEGANPELDDSIERLTKDPYDRGWLFRMRGEPDTGCFDVEGYVATLDTTIEKMLGQRHETG